MAKQLINVGTIENDGNGDTLREAFQKVNNNFNELFVTSGALRHGNSLVDVQDYSIRLAVENNTLVTLSETEVLIRDTDFTLLNRTDKTKRAKFDLILLPENETQTYRLPQFSSMLIGDTTAQTMSNKTISDSVINKSNVISVVDTNFTLLSDSSNAKSVKFSLTPLAIGSDRVISIPDASFTIVGENTGQTLLNKTMDGAYNTFSNINLTTSMTGILPVTQGGTGIATVPHEYSVLIGDSNGKWKESQILAGTNISISRTSDGLTIHSTAQVAYTDRIASNNSQVLVTDDGATPGFIDVVADSTLTERITSATTERFTPLKLALGQPTADKAPIYFQSGSLLLTPEDGALEFDGNNLYFTSNSVRQTLSVGGSANALSAGNSTLILTDPGAGNLALTIDGNVTAYFTATGSIFKSGALGITNGTGTSTFSSAGQTGSFVWTMPNATDTVVGRQTTDTLTNKSLDGNQNTFSNIDIANPSVTTGQLAVTRGGTAADTPAGARSNLGAAQSGANTDITSLAPATTGSIDNMSIGVVSPQEGHFTNGTFSGNVHITATTASADPFTGALVIDGGLGVAGETNIQGDTHISGNLVVNGTSASSSTVTFTGPLLELNAAAVTPQDANDSGIWVHGSDANLRYIYASNRWVSNLGIEAPTFYGSLVGGVQTASQPNITSVGTLNGLTVGGTGINGTIATAAQPNITSVGTLNGLTVGGSGITGALLTAAQTNVTSLGTLTGLTSTGVVSILNNTAATSSVTGALKVSGGVGVGGNLVVNNSYGIYGTVMTAAQPQITSVGNLTQVTAGGVTISGNSISSTGSTLTIDPAAAGVTGTVVIAGNLQVTGTTTTVNSTTTTVDGLTFVLANNTTTAAQANGAGMVIGGPANATWLYNNSTDSLTANKSIVTSGNLTGTVINGTLNTQAQPNITSVGTLTSLTVGAGGIAGTLTTAAQPNITSLGTLSSLSVTGNLSAANIAGTITTAAQPNITSVGTLSNLMLDADPSAALGAATKQYVDGIGNIKIGNGTTQQISANLRSERVDFIAGTNVSLTFNDTNNSITIATTGTISGNADTATALQTGRTIGITGDATWTSPAFDGTANVTANITLASTGVTAGTYQSVTVDTKGRVTGGTTVSNTITLSGDITGSGTTGASITTTLANSGVTAGTYKKVTVDAKGRVTGSGSTFSAAAGAPASPMLGDEWYDTGTNTLNKYINNGVTNVWTNVLSGITATSAATASTIVQRDASAGAAFAAVTATTLTVSSTINATGNGTQNIGSVSNKFGTIYGTASSAQYADLAEVYASDENYAPGTVVVFGGEFEVTESTSEYDSRVAGVVSTNPAYLMNSEASGVAVALQGRVPCLVKGPIQKGDMLVTSELAGIAKALEKGRWEPGVVIGKALENVDSNVMTTIEVVVGRV